MWPSPGEAGQMGSSPGPAQRSAPRGLPHSRAQASFSPVSVWLKNKASDVGCVLFSSATCPGCCTADGCVLVSRKGVRGRQEPLSAAEAAPGMLRHPHHLPPQGSLRRASCNHRPPRRGPGHAPHRLLPHPAVQCGPGSWGPRQHKPGGRPHEGVPHTFACTWKG